MKKSALRFIAGYVGIGLLFSSTLTWSVSAKINTDSDSVVETQHNWMYEGFNEDSGWNGIAVGETSTDRSLLPQGWKGTNGNGTFNSFKRLGTVEDSFLGVTGASAVNISTQYGVDNTGTDELRMKFYDESGSMVDWTEFYGTMVLSFDLLYPDVEGGETAVFGNATVSHEYKDSNDEYKTANFFNLLGKSNGGLSGGVINYYNMQRIDGNSSGHYYVAISSQPGLGGDLRNHWNTFTYKITRYRDGEIGTDGNTYSDGDYTIEHFINGSPLIVNTREQNGHQQPYIYDTIKTDSSYIEYLKDTNADYEYLGPVISISNMWSDGVMGIDNIRMSVYENTTVDSFVNVEAGETVATINVYNTAVTSENAPLEAKAGVLDDLRKNANASYQVLASKNGEAVPAGEVSIDVESTEKWGKDKFINGEQIRVNIPALSEGEQIVLEFEGLKDINKESLVNTKTVVFCGKVVADVEFTDALGNLITESKTDDVYDVDSDVKIIDVVYPDSNPITLKDNSGNVVATSTVIGGMRHKIRLSSYLTSNTLYGVYNSLDEKLFDIMTGDAVLKYGETVVVGGCLTVPYSSSHTTNKTAILIASSFDGDVQKDVLSTAANILPLNEGEITLDRALAAAETEDAFILNDLCLSTMTENADAIKIAPFSEEHIASLSGKLGKSGKYPILVLDGEDNIVYARRVVTDATGNYTLSLNLNNFATNSYRVVVYTENGVFYVRTAHAETSDNNTALELLKNADTLEKMNDIFFTKDGSGVINGVNYSNLNKLEFVFEVFDKLTLSEQQMAVKYYFDCLGENEMSVNRKEDAVKGFRQATVMAAITAGKGDMAKNFFDNLDALKIVPVEKWYNINAKVVESRTQKWQAGIVTRISGKQFISLSDFNNKFVEALVYEAVADHGTTAILQEVFSDFNADYIKAGSDSRGNSIISLSYVAELSKNNKRYNEFDGFSKLKADLLAFESVIFFEKGNASGSYSPGGGGGGTIGLSSGPVTQPAVPQKKTSFSDLKGFEWAVEAIEALAEKKIINGKAEGVFAPEDNVTREEFTKLIIEAVGIEDSSTDISFLDVKPEDWCFGYIKKAYGAGIIKGISEEMFGTGNDISRQDMAVIIYNAMNREQITVTDEATFADSADIADYAKAAVSTLTELGIFNGYEDGCFRPNGRATRAEAAKVIYMALELLS